MPPKEVIRKDDLFSYSCNGFIYGKTEAEVRRKLREYRRSPEAVMTIDPSALSVESYFNMFLSATYLGTVKQSTYDRMEAVVRGTIVPAIGAIQMKNLMSEDIQKVLRDMVDSGKAYSTVKKTYDAFNKILSYAVKRKAIPDDPMEAVVCPARSTFKQKEIRWLTEEEEAIVLAELDRQYVSSGAPAYQYRNAYRLMLNTGLRLGEMIALNKDDIDLAKKTLRICKDAIIVKERDKDGEYTGKYVQIVQENPKTSKANRQVPLNKAALAAASALVAEMPDNPYVCHTKTGKRTLCNTLYRQLQTVYAKCGIEGANDHTLRHTFATRLFEKGASLKDVSVLLGHSSITVTANTYIHVLQERKQGVADLLDE